MSLAQAMPSQPKNPWIVWIWSALGGVAVGAVIASGVWWFAWWQRERRFQAELMDPGVRFGSAVLNRAGDLIAGDGSGVNPAGLVGKFGDLLSGGGSTPPANTETSAKAETSPTKDELAAYFDGKTLPLPNGVNLVLSNGEQSQKSCVMTKEGVEAVDKGPSQPTYGDIQAFFTPITFLYKGDDARYAVSVQVQHKPVGDKTAFFGFTVIKVARQ